MVSITHSNEPTVYKKNRYYQILFISAALFNFAMAALFIGLYPSILGHINHADITQEPLSHLFVCLFGLAVFLFGCIYSWIGLNITHPYSYPLTIISILGKSGVFLVMSTSAALSIVPWGTGPIFSIVDGIYAILFTDYFLNLRRIIHHNS